MTSSATTSEASLGLAWLSTFGCSPLLRLLGRHSPDAIWTASRSSLAKWGLTKAAVGRFEGRRREFDAPAAAKAVQDAGLLFVSHDQCDYPNGLRHLPLPPAGLFVRGGRIPLAAVMATPRVVIVGTRKPTPYGLLLAEAFAATFARAGVTVVSGLAMGIDGRSHEGALWAGGMSIAVLGCGADVIYPRSHRKLYSMVADQGAVLSELPPGATPTRWTFPQRNRVLAALGDAVLVVEAGVTSGALQTADWALELGRPVFAVPGPITGENHRGTNRLIYEGAFPALDPAVTVEDFLLLTRIERGDRRPIISAVTSEAGTGSLFAYPVSPGKGENRRDGDRSDASPAEKKVLQWLCSGALSVDALVERTGLSVREVTAGLARLHVRGEVTRAGPGLFIRAP